jgi:hypothetical protein
MPLMKYFCFVGSALVLLLFGLDWFLTRPVSDPWPQGGRQVSHQDQLSRTVTRTSCNRP